MTTTTLPDAETDMVQLGESLTDYLLKWSNGQHTWEKELQVPLPLEIVSVRVHRVNGGYLLRTIRTDPDTGRGIETYQQVYWEKPSYPALGPGHWAGPGGLFILKDISHDPDGQIVETYRHDRIEDAVPEQAALLKELHHTLGI